MTFRLAFTIAFLFILFCIVFLIPYDVLDPASLGGPIKLGGGN